MGKLGPLLYIIILIGISLSSNAGDNHVHVEQVGSGDNLDLNISQIKNSTKILDEQVDTQVKNTQITPEQGEAIKKNFRATQSATNKAKR